VLVVVVLVMLAVFGLGHALLLAARFELAAAQSGARQLEARAAAESAVELALRTGGGPWMDSVPLWEFRADTPVVVGGVPTVARFRRLGAEGWLVEATAQRSGGPAAQAARLAWSLDPLERLLSWPAILSVGPGAPFVLDGTVDASRVAHPDAALTAAHCAVPASAALGPLASVLPLGVLPAEHPQPALGELDFDALLALAPLQVAGTGTPTPTERFGACVDEPWGWGDPERPYRPCGASHPVRASAGDLVVDGGVGQGLLVVDGDLTLRAGARFFGVVLARGTLRLEAGSELVGYGVAGGGAVVAAGARATGSACRALRALVANRALLAKTLARVEPIGPF
jgi:hypothetical protein